MYGITPVTLLALEVLHAYPMISISMTILLQSLQEIIIEKLNLKTELGLTLLAIGKVRYNTDHVTAGGCFTCISHDQ